MRMRNVPTSSHNGVPIVRVEFKCVGILIRRDLKPFAQSADSGSCFAMNVFNLVVPATTTIGQIAANLICHH